MKVLITGFEPIHEETNASFQLVQSLQENLPSELVNSASFNFQILPGNTLLLEAAINELLNKIEPDICIGVGQANYNKITFERMAKNLLNFDSPDNAENQLKWQLIDKKGPAAYWGTLSAYDEMIDLLEDHKIPAGMSSNCGEFLCNQIFYHFLRWREHENRDIKAGFIHIPVLPEQTIKQWPNYPSMPIELTRKALTLITLKQIAAFEK